MSVAIRYYTRSGNTQKLAEAISKEINVPAESIDKPLDEKVDVLFIGCSYYAFDMDENVKKFLAENQDKIGKLVIFGTSAMINSMKKPMEKVLEGLNIELADEEFHCKGSFGPMHKGRPNADDLSNAANFAKKVIG